MADLWAAEGQLNKLMIRPEYLRLTNDLTAGVFLSQVVYWFRPKKGGKPSTKIEREGRAWIVRTQAEWCADLCIGLKLFRTVLERVEHLGVVEHRVWKYGNRPVLHIGLNLQRLLELVNGLPPNGEQVIPDYAPGIQSIMPVGNNPLCPGGTLNYAPGEQSYIEQSITESTDLIALAQAQGTPVATLKEQMESKAKTHHGVGAVWQAETALAIGGFQKPLTLKEQSQLKAIREYIQGQKHDPLPVLTWVIQNWVACTTQVKYMAGLSTTPGQPGIGWVLQHVHQVLDCWANSTKPVEAYKPPPVPVQLIAQPDDGPYKPSPEEIAELMAKLHK